MAASSSGKKDFRDLLTKFKGNNSDEHMGEQQPNAMFGKRTKDDIENPEPKAQRSNKRNGIDRSDSEQAAQTENGSKPKGRGKGKGKTYHSQSQSDQEPGTIAQLCELNRTAAIRLLQNQREKQAMDAFILEIHSSALELRKEMQALSQAWKSERPNTGPHPYGALSQILFSKIIDYMSVVFSELESITPEQKDSQQRFQRFLEHWKHETRENCTIVGAFHPLGRKERPTLDKPWLWHLQIDANTTRGRAQHEWLRENLNEEGDYCVGLITFKRDRGAMDALERKLRGFKLA
jgi:hypothetical protein